MLIPCTFGPDIMMRSGNVLLIGQVKSYLVGTAKDTLSAGTMSKALKSLCEDHWFHTITANQSVRPWASLLCPAVMLNSL